MINNYIFFTSLIIFLIGIYKILTSESYWSKIIGLSVMQSSVLLFYIALGKAKSGIIPILIKNKDIIYSSPLPHVLMLTAIVVGFSTTAVALKLLLVKNKLD